MKLCTVGGLAVMLAAGGLIVAAPPASAGCLYGGPVISKCDGPVQPDGTWQRCTAVYNYVPSGLSSHLVPVKRCDLMGPGHDYPFDFTFTDPPTHIDD
ncbi:hypothetical protein BTO20_29945 [Mycobacterium dioxanotrophicus]|jgi:hypothetical protein|uniref:CDGP domain-containing protein n=1 Tax=Mycobacterium dioxanotrophicus TaxID=482462 RepID=A0A1Y0CAW2_9MYCO|nr:hypothetical protein [Mycobacterium dioxanotrophicus]ART72217.1 hypothetical protein BTO20_29945 [Mycobacterium dioxanotrophicus]